MPDETRGDAAPVKRGRGRPKGSISRHTIDKLYARELVRQEVLARIGPLVEAQIANASGLKYLVARDKKTGKFVRISEDEADAFFALGEASPSTVIEVWDKDPNVQAFIHLLDRALDRVKEQEQEIKLSGSVDIVQRLQAARKRIKA